MTPYEMMLSESQERMLLVAARGREREVIEVFAKWGLDAVEIGRVNAGRSAAHHLRRQRRRGNSREGSRRRSAGVSASNRARLRIRAAQDSCVKFAPDSAANANLTANFLKLLAWPAIASKRWIFEQYDHMVRTNTLEGPGAGDAAVLRVKGTARALALTVDGNGRWCWLDPREGAKAAVAEAARNVACSGARPVGRDKLPEFRQSRKTRSDVGIQRIH